MRYTVVWHEDAQNELARIWITAIEKSAVTHAADEIDTILHINPSHQGQAFQGRQILAVPPLAVAFNVDHDNRIVRIEWVRRDSSAN